MFKTVEKMINKDKPEPEKDNSVVNGVAGLIGVILLNIALWPVVGPVLGFIFSIFITICLFSVSVTAIGWVIQLFKKKGGTDD